MIKSFACKNTENIFYAQKVRKFSLQFRKAACRRLKYLNSASDLFDLGAPPSNRLEKLKGLTSKSYSIRINRQWRITFIWSKGHAYNVCIEDYH